MGDGDADLSGDLFSGIEGAEELDFDKTESEFELPKRPRGILSHTDREYLLGLREYKHKQSEANRRQDIRERVVNALEDYLLLRLFLEKEEREKIFEQELDTDLLNDCLEAMITFVYLGLDQDENRLEEIIERGVLVGANLERNDRSMGDATNVEATIDIDYDPDVDALHRRMKESGGETLTPAEIGVLVRSGKVDYDDLETLSEDDQQSRGLAIGQSILDGLREAGAEDEE